MNTSTIDCRRQLNDLIAVLDEEETTLQSSDPDALAQVLRVKDSLCVELASLQSTLIDYLQHDQAEDGLITLLRECQQKNQRNGRLIEQRRTAVQQRLAEVDTGSSYSSAGEVDAGHRAVSGWQA